jgi:restriction endonuclease S subunit
MITQETPHRWHMKRLVDVCDINPSKREIEDLRDDTKVSFLPMAGVSENGILLDLQLKTLKEVRKGFTYFRNGDVLFAKITPCMENGKRWLANSLINDVGFGSTEFHVLRPKSEVTPEWIYYYVSQQSFRDNAEKNMTGTAGQKRVPKQYIENLTVPVPPIDTQMRLIENIRIADRLKLKRKQTNQMLNKIPKTIFMQMFRRSPERNKEYVTEKLGDLCHRITDGTHITPRYTDSGIPFLRVTDLTESNSSKKFISEKEHRELTKRCKPEKGDVLYSKNGTIGVAKLIDWDYEFSIFVSLCLLKVKKEIIRPKYLESFLNTPLALNQANLHSKTGTITNLHLIEIKKIEVPVPTIDEQDEFIQKLEEVNSIYNKQQQATREITELFNSLMAEAFRNEALK